MLRAYVSSGGGARIGATFGAVLEGERHRKFKAGSFDACLGTSAGALDAALTANGWDGRMKISLFLDTDFGAMVKPALLPFGLRKAFSVVKPMQLERLAEFIDELGLKPVEGLLINTVDAETNTHIVYCETKPKWWPADAKATLVEGAFTQLGFGTVITRSMALPGLVADDPRYMDGGIAENPLLSVLPSDAQILMVHLGYAGLLKDGGDTVPKGLLNRAMYAYERKAYELVEHLMSHYSKLRAIFPKVYDVDSTAFNLSYSAKLDMVNTARLNTKPQWEAL